MIPEAATLAGQDHAQIQRAKASIARPNGCAALKAGRPCIQAAERNKTCRAIARHRGARRIRRRRRVRDHWRRRPAARLRRHRRRCAARRLPCCSPAVACRSGRMPALAAPTPVVGTFEVIQVAVFVGVIGAALLSAIWLIRERARTFDGECRCCAARSPNSTHRCSVPTRCSTCATSASSSGAATTGSRNWSARCRSEAARRRIAAPSWPSAAG